MDAMGSNDWYVALRRPRPDRGRKTDVTQYPNSMECAQCLP